MPALQAQVAIQREAETSNDMPLLWLQSEHQQESSLRLFDGKEKKARAKERGN